MVEASSVGTPETGSWGGPVFAHRVFHHLSAPKCSAYRAVLGVFVAARACFEVALRPSEVAARLTVYPDGTASKAELEAEVEACLVALREWGNLTATRDIVSARTIAEYLSPRFLYQLTPAGEMAERALGFFEQGLRSRGELSTTALREIGDTLEILRHLLEAPELDAPKAERALRDLTGSFDQLVTRAQSFIGGLQHELDRPGAEESAFLALKEELIGYLDRFVRELIASTHRIRFALQDMDRFDLGPLFAAAVQADLANAFVATAEDRIRVEMEWSSRWQGLRRWFIGGDGVPSQSATLRDRAMDAVPTLLQRVRRINDQRANRADRATDFLVLARWFAHAPSEPDLHRLWRVAFALAPARHLRINAATLLAWEELPATPRATWEDAPPFVISIAQWERGQVAPRGAPPGVINRSAARAALRAREAAERSALHDARRSLASRTPARLGELADLDVAQFEVLLDAVGEAFALLAPGDTEAEATTTDGEMQIRIRMPAPRSLPATLRTPEGDLLGPDLWVECRLLDEDSDIPVTGSETPDR